MSRPPPGSVPEIEVTSLVTVPPSASFVLAALATLCPIRLWSVEYVTSRSGLLRVTRTVPGRSTFLRNRRSS
ncbi:MAG: hypothetical protein E6G45_08240 [Actinobacteria bacterium]|nr:MAG: hypothetical protein E6G45_08240 [Actinomycetota bacterium]